MSTLSTTKLSSKGQVVIPDEIRGTLDLKTGTQFVVWAEKDVIILKTIHPSSFSDFEKISATTPIQLAPVSDLPEKEKEKEKN